MKPRSVIVLMSVLLAGTLFAQAPSRTAVDHAGEAARALFVYSDISAANQEITAALAENPSDTRAVFVAMEAAALDDDDASVLRNAARLCDAAETVADDEMCEIAAGRINELAGSSKTFRTAIPEIRKLIAMGSPESGAFRLALAAAASDGAPEFETLMQSRESGLLTDWKIVGPLGKYSNTDFDRSFGPEQDGLRKKSYGSRRVETFQFINGRIEVPDAGRHAGVFYAAADLELDGGGEWRVWIESPGTMEVFVDGRSVIRKDDRSQAQPQVEWKMRHMDGGVHRVVVKFLASALPFRVAVMAPAGGVKKRLNKPAMHAGPESEYVSVALRYWRRDYGGYIRALRTASAQLKSSAPANLLLSQAWMRESSGDAPESRAALLTAEKSAPRAAAVRLALGEQAARAERTDDALEYLKPVLRERPGDETSLRLFAQLAARLHWRSDAIRAYGKLVEAHPSCANVRDAAWYLAGIGEYAAASTLEPPMKSCAPQSLVYAQWLAQAGRHQESARAAAEIAREFPLDRAALKMKLEEATLASDASLAQSAALALGELSGDDRPPLAAGASPANPRAAGFFNSQEFYSQYRRDGVQVVQAAESKKFSGGPAVLLLHDKVAKLDADGRTAVYVHTITRVLNRDGIERYGEVSVPAGATILELRTIKPDGTVSEPELNQHKATISMPALSPGDAIEQEYVTWHSGDAGVTAHKEAFEFAFGSFNAPILTSRFVLLSPADVEVAEIGGAPKTTRDSRLVDGTRVRAWERNDIAQSTNEGRLPREDLFPIVRVAGVVDNCTDLQATARDAAIEASRVGPRVEALAESVEAADAESVARALYTRVVNTVASDASDFSAGEVTSAEETLTENEGSRTATLLALARARNLPADLAMARAISAGTTERYSHPLLVFHLPQHDVVVDVESDGMPFGVLGPGLDRSSALLVALDSLSNQALAWIKLPPLEGDQLSLAEGNVVFDNAGTFTARTTIVMGAWRAAQMREILRGIPGAERKHFFEQLAARLFPGAADADGRVENENDLNLPLRLEVTCNSPHYLDLASATVDMDQLVPTLGLRKMYAMQVSRQFPMVIDSLLFESAIFRVRLPDGVRIVRRVGDLDLGSEFGSYRAQFRELPDGTLEVRREFRIPVQIVRPARYAEFTAFANRIDETERQRLTLGVDHARLGRATQQQ